MFTLVAVTVMVTLPEIPVFYLSMLQDYTPEECMEWLLYSHVTNKEATKENARLIGIFVRQNNIDIFQYLLQRIFSGKEQDLAEAADIMRVTGITVPRLCGRTHTRNLDAVAKLVSPFFSQKDGKHIDASLFYHFENEHLPFAA